MVFRIFRSDAISVWKNEEILKRFSHYKGILDNEQVARYLIAKTLPCEFNVNASVEELRELLKEKSKELNDLFKVDLKELESRDVKPISYIDLVETLANEYLEHCIFCERKCGINRKKKQTGFCFLTADSYISSGFLHMGEEAPLIPSGTIFFQGCNLECVFCQNCDISQTWKNRRELGDIAQKVNGRQLADLAERLVEKGAYNINYVGGDPIPNMHTIINNLKYQASNVCQLWNSNFYLTDESLSLIIDLMDFWLPDFKYGNNRCGEKYSGVKNYFDVVSRNHKRIYDEGSGEIIIRHLVMPNHVECCSKPILDFIAKEIPMGVVNIMAQYRPEYRANEYQEINRRPTSEEIQEVKTHADKLGILYEPVS